MKLRNIIWINLKLLHWCAICFSFNWTYLKYMYVCVSVCKKTSARSFKFLRQLLRSKRNNGNHNFYIKILINSSFQKIFYASIIDGTAGYVKFPPVSFHSNFRCNNFLSNIKYGRKCFSIFRVSNVFQSTVISNPKHSDAWILILFDILEKVAKNYSLFMYF